MGILGDPQAVHDEIMAVAAIRQSFGKFVVDPSKNTEKDRIVEQDDIDIIRKIPKHPLPTTLSNRILDEIENPEARLQVEKIWKGHDLFAWYFVGEYNGRDAIYIEFKWIKDKHNEESLGCFLCFLDHDYRNAWLPELTYDFPFQNLTIETRNMVISRILHWFVRRHHCCTNESMWSPVHTHKIIDFLLDFYPETGQWKDYYDVICIRSKMELRANGGRMDTEQDRTNRFATTSCICEALEGMKKLQQSANFRLEARADFCMDHENGEYLIMMTVMAGTSLKCANKYPQSEQCYLEAAFLRRSVLETKRKAGSTPEEKDIVFDPNCNLEFPLWNALIDLYRSWSTGEDQLNTVHLILLALLLQLGWTKPDCVTSLKVVENLPRKVLKQQYQTKRAASDAIFAVFASKEPNHVRSFLLALASPTAGTIRLNFVPEVATPQERALASNRPSVKQISRAKLVSHKQSHPTPMCFVCKKTLEQELRCPCQTVNYCGKACQKIHWTNGHKKTCPKFANK